MGRWGERRGDEQNLSLTFISSQDEQEAAQQKRSPMAGLSLQTQRGLNPGDLLGPVSDVICGTFITYYHLTCTVLARPYLNTPNSLSFWATILNFPLCAPRLHYLSSCLSVTETQHSPCVMMCSVFWPLIYPRPARITLTAFSPDSCGSSCYDLPPPFG